MQFDCGQENRSTKVYYYLEDNTPYLSVLPVPDDSVTLGDFKKVFNRRGYRYYCKQFDKAIGSEVKVELCDVDAKLQKSANGLIELVLMTMFTDSCRISGTLPKTADRTSQMRSQTMNRAVNNGTMKRQRSLHDITERGFCEDYNVCNNRQTLNPTVDKNSATVSSQSTVISKRAGERLADHYMSNSEEFYHNNLQDCSLIGSGPCSSSCGAFISSDVNNFRCKAHRRRKPRKNRYRKAYVPSTISSVTESSMTSLSLPHIDAITLPMKNGSFLGICVLSHDGGVFVSEIIGGGAVALDGRIEVGDQIVQVNQNSFENLSDLQAVQLLRQAAMSRKPVTLYVAKTSCRFDAKIGLLELASETMPIDVSLWVESSKQNNVKPIRPFVIDETLSTVGNDVSQAGKDIDIEEVYTERNRHALKLLNKMSLKSKQASNNTKLLSAEDCARRRENQENEQLNDNLNVNMDPTIILKLMSRADSGLQIKNRKWLKIPVPMSFIGQDLVNWLIERVKGISDRKSARTYASKLLENRQIHHVVNKLTFTEKCYYIFDDSILSPKDSGPTSSVKVGPEATTEVTYIGSPALQASRAGIRNENVFNDSLVNGRKKTALEESWPVSTRVGWVPHHRRDCESPLTNDYASVIGSDVITSNMLVPTLNGCNNAVAQPPNTPESVLIRCLDEQSFKSETEFEFVDGESQNMLNT